MLEFILSYYFLILWGLSLSVLILLAICIIYKKEFSSKLVAIYEKIVKDDPYKLKIDSIHEDINNNNVCIMEILTNIQDQEEHIKIYDKIIDSNLKNSSPPMIFDVNELSQDIAETLSAKLQAKKVDKLSKGN